MSRYNYVITIKEPDYKRVDSITFLMLLLSVVFFVYTAAHQWSSGVYHKVAILYIIIPLFIAAWSVYAFINAKKKASIPFYRVALLAAAAGWFIEPVRHYWMSGLYLIAALLERQVKFPQEMGVDDIGITFNTLPQKEYEWKDINNLLLKEGILTVDYKNNKLFQQEIASDVTPALEREFNQYCQLKLKAANISNASSVDKV